MYRVSKRDGVVVDFNVTKISAAIEKAFIACNKCCKGLYPLQKKS